ncbi:MAG: hypothetical protein KME49_23135 [Brasilonema octagenarum HA4186-MV1]|jgi:hypothetical protein|uniref:PepSY domain-containing protein n=1 Tax=Brasilonema octagenarum UFV-OR1 TaxID=417115 RepID=A0ABX1MBR4_9CYAN|nr:hypothetical protein [Brasilonema octagenarum]MBW4628325.1 hypothetical protein [Brasilonema octagenarum HA4186-MV1]NMF65988.1 hypothetical protein [Brasilonema octagenarum UFV-OR1]
MKNTLKNYSTTKQAQFFTALVLSGILSVGCSLWAIKSATAAPANYFADTANQVLKENIKTNNLPRTVASAILQDLSNREPTATKKLEIIDYTQRTWRNGCMDLPNPDELCTQALVPGWRVVLSNGNQTWIYHTDSNGRSIRLANPYILTSVAQNFPNYIEDAVLQAASQRLNLPTSEFTIIQAQQQTWNNGCLNLPRSDEACTQALEKGWRVVVKATNQTLVYHTNATGSKIRFNKNESNFSEGKLPAIVRDAVLRRATEESGLPASSLSIVASQPTRWNGCELQNNAYPCDNAISGWQVTVAAGLNRWVFFTDERGSRIQLSQQYGETPNVNLPRDIAERVLVRASKRLGAPISQVRIVEVKQRQWPDSCLGLADPSTVCAAVIVPGWEVTVSDGQQRLVYRVGESGAVFLDEKASPVADDNNTSLKPISIPRSELPPPLDSSVIFRQISSGGFAGRTYETVLLDDGRLIRVRIGDTNDSERRIRRIPHELVERFQQLLERQSDEFRNLSYPAPNGAADYITYTLTSRDGTVKYNDISQNSLPKDLRLIVKAWNRISNRSQ